MDVGVKSGALLAFDTKRKFEDGTHIERDDQEGRFLQVR